MKKDSFLNLVSINNFQKIANRKLYRFFFVNIGILFIGLVVLPLLWFGSLKKEDVAGKSEKKFNTEFRFRNYYDEKGNRKPNPKPQQIYGPIYYVGSLEVCAYLVKTDKGLLMFDSGFDRDVDFISSNIKELGLNPMDINRIFITHWHEDHSSGAARLSNMSGAEIFIHKNDADTLRNKIFVKKHMQPAIKKISELKGGEEYNYGDVTVKVVHTPGQTAGEVIFLVTVNGPNGKCVAIVAGDATAMKSTVAEFEPNKFPGIIKAYEKTVEILKSLEFNLYLGGHPHQVFKEMREDGNPFVKREEWHKMVDNRNQQKINFLKKHPEYKNY